MDVLVMTECNVLRAGFEKLIAGPDSPALRFASTPEETLQLVQDQRPDLVIIPSDAEGALEACSAITARTPDLPVLFVSTALDDDVVRSAIEAGAAGLLFQSAEPAEFRVAVKRLVAGQSVIDPRIAGKVIAWARNHPEEEKSIELSPREFEVMRYVIEGEPNKRIARRMSVSENTVKTYLRRVYRKLGCHSRSAAAAVVARKGILRS